MLNPLPPLFNCKLQLFYFVINLETVPSSLERKKNLKSHLIHCKIPRFNSAWSLDFKNIYMLGSKINDKKVRFHSFIHKSATAGSQTWLFNRSSYPPTCIYIWNRENELNSMHPFSSVSDQISDFLGPSCSPAGTCRLQYNARRA